MHISDSVSMIALKNFHEKVQMNIVQAQAHRQNFSLDGLTYFQRGIEIALHVKI